MKKILLTTLSVVLASVMFAGAVAATPSFPSYVISEDDVAMRVPEPYVVDYIISLPSVAEGTFSKPIDLFVDEQDQIYVVENGNNRVLKISQDGKILQTIGEGILNSPSGVFANEEGIYVADTANNRIAIFDPQGTYKSEIVRPDSPLLETDFSFSPEKLIVDDRGYFYVVCTGNENGLLMIDKTNEFRGFFGANITQVSFIDILIRIIYPREAREGNMVTLPYSYINVGINDGYLYTSTTGADIDQIRRLGPSGGDAPFGGEHKDFRDVSLISEGKEQNFVDFAVDASGNLLVLEETYGRIYQYDSNGKMLFAFGNTGVKKGNLQKPASIAVDSQNYLYVADSERNNIIVYKPTEFTLAVNVANQLYNEGKYEEAYSHWEEVLKVNNHYEIAQQAMGYILLRQEKYPEAMEKFTLANDKDGYSEAFEEQRAVVIAEYFPFIVLGIVVLIILLFILSTVMRKRSKKKEKKEVFDGFHPFKAAWRAMWHPFDLFDMMKFRRQVRYSHAITIVGSYVLVRIICVFCTSYLYRSTSLQMTDWVFEIGLAVLPWLLLSLSNYGICTLVDGEGKFKEVFVSGAYALAPFLFFSIPIALLTNVFSLNEYGFHEILILIQFLLCIFIVYAAHQEVHNLSIGKTILIAVLSIVGALLLGYLMVLFYGLLSQVVAFVSQIMKEVSLLAF